MEKMMKFGLVAKVLFLRELNAEFSTDFSVDACLAKPSFKRMIRVGFQVFKKKDLPYPMAFGLNNSGKLGVGSNRLNVEEFQPIQFSETGPISRVFIGDEHTIFCFTNGKFYGAGKSINFLDKFDDKPDTISTPTLLSYINGRRYFNREDGTMRDMNVLKNTRMMCQLNARSTTFIHYNSTQSLIVGPVHGQVPVSGQNWKLVEKIEPRQPPLRNTVVSNLEGVPTNVAIRAYCNRWSEQEFGFQQIIFLICGARVNAEKLLGKVRYCENGIVWVLHEKTLYTGVLKFVAENTLMAVVKEVIFEYSVDCCDVSKDGKSVVVYPLVTEQMLRDHANSSKTNYKFQTVDRSIVDTHLDFSFDLYTELARADRILSESRGRGLLNFTGLPTPENRQRYASILALRDFVRVDDDARLPTVINEIFASAGEEFHPRVELKSRAIGVIFNNAIIYPHVVAAGWSMEERELRMSQINQHSRDLCTDTLTEVKEAIASLRNLPLEYRQQSVDHHFKAFVAFFLHQISKNPPAIVPGEEPEVLKAIYFENHKNAKISIEERIRHGDIDEEEHRFQTIRLEAVLISKDFIEPFVTHTTMFHLKATCLPIIEHVKDGVLSLNRAYQASPGDNFEDREKLFRVYVNEIFGEEVFPIMRSVPYRTLKSMLNAAPSEDHYRISTNDNRIVPFPKILFELHSSGYDASRVRNAVRNGKNLNEFSLDLSENELEHLAEVLFDDRSIDFLEIDTLLKLLDVSRYCLLTEIVHGLIDEIVRKASPSHSHVLRELFCHHPQETAASVAEQRPEMFIYWKEMPIAGNYLKTLGEVMNYMFHVRYVTVKHPFGYVENRPLALVPDTWISQRLDKKWLCPFYFDQEKDHDLIKEFERTLRKWHPSNLVSRKRKYK